MSLPRQVFKRLIVAIGQSNRRVGSSSGSSLVLCDQLFFRRGLRSAKVERKAGPDSRFGAPRKGRQKMKKYVLPILLALLFLPVSSRAQGLGSIEGRVTDPEGASVPNAKVTAVQVGTGFSRAALSDSGGLYVIPSLQPATYDLTIEATGFGTSKESGVILLADQTLTVNFGLKLGMNTEVVMVSGNALQVDTSTSTLKQVIEQQRISELPLNGRNAAQLTLLVAGAVNSPNGGADQGATKTFPGAVTYSANGARQDTISY
jgi:hypothetical protein